MSSPKKELHSVIFYLSLRISLYKFVCFFVRVSRSFSVFLCTFSRKQLAVRCFFNFIVIIFIISNSRQKTINGGKQRSQKLKVG